jgi:hypothetical protein
MADFVPSTIIQTPDFLGMAQQRQNQIKKEKAATYNYINDYKQTGENYLEGFIPAVQQEWNQVESAMNAVAGDDNTSTRRALDNAYANYAKVAGKAKYLTENYYQNTSSFRSDPSSFGMSFDEYDKTSQMYRYTPQTANSLLALEDYVIPKRRDFEIKAPDVAADRIFSQLQDRIDKEFTNPNTGKVNIARAVEAAEEILDMTVNFSPENVEMATVWGGIDMGLIGNENQIRNEQQLQFILGQADEKKSEMKTRYNKATMNIFTDRLARMGDVKTQAGKASQEYAGMTGYRVPNLLVYGSRNPLSENVTAFPIPESDQIDTSMKYDDVKDDQGRAKELREKVTEVMVDENGQVLVKVQGDFKDKKGSQLPAQAIAIIGNIPGVSSDRDVYTTVRPATPSEIARLNNAPGLGNVFKKLKSGELDVSVDVANPLGISGQNSVPSSNSNPLGLNL